MWNRCRYKYVSANQIKENHSMKNMSTIVLICVLSISCNSKIQENRNFSSEESSNVIIEPAKEKTSLKEIVSTSELSKEQQTEIDKLHDAKSKENYLTKLYTEYMNTNPERAQGAAIQHGWDSSEYKEALTFLKIRKEKIYIKIKHYLRLHGYPSEIGAFNWQAKTIIQTVIKDRRNYEEQNEVYQLLANNQSGNSNNLLGMSLILSEMYKTKNNGRSYEFSSSDISLEETVIELSKELGLKYKND